VVFPPKADLLILDAQQRLITLTQVLALKSTAKPHHDNGKHVEPYHYLHLPTTLEGPERLENILLALEPDRKQNQLGQNVMPDVSTDELKCCYFYFLCSNSPNLDSREESLNEYAP
jgi:hypothetical protein